MVVASVLLCVNVLNRELPFLPIVLKLLRECVYVGTCMCVRAHTHTKMEFLMNIITVQF